MMDLPAGPSSEERRKPVSDLFEPLDRTSDLSLVDQFQRRLVRALEEGVLEVHGRLPSERELATRLGVSRLTVNRALARLVADGTLYAERGRGTFVADRKIKQPLRELTSFSEDVASRGQRPSSRVLSQAVVPTPLEFAAVFGIPERSELVRITRLRLADDEPLAIETAHLPHALCRGILAFDLAERSLYGLLRQEYGLRLASAKQTIEADRPTDEEREVLGLPEGTPVLRTARITYAVDGVVVEFVRAVFRGDRHQLTVELK
jgi:GntR family transcriptional regulator